MKTLILVRHAEAERTAEFTNDFKRPLSQNGIKQAEEVAKRYSEMYDLPDYCVASDAERAKQTSEIFLKQFKIPKESLNLRNELYTGNVNNLFYVIQQTNNAFNRLMLVGHNPSVSRFAGCFINGENYIMSPTAGVITLNFACDRWDEITKCGVSIEGYLYPKNI